ncbi:MAG TPA: hypothetical protein VNK24_09550 [Elusimicrobiota bacterium]|nr:hypothetical protein [Elusimicrobiota bacterium]
MNMKTAYLAMLGLLLILFILADLAAWRSSSWIPIKDLGLPLAALILTAGQLYIGEKQHDQQRKDQYWDKRFNYLVRLRELYGTICYKFSSQDIAAAAVPGADFGNTALGKIYWSLADLELEGDILFADIGQSIAKIGEQFKIVHQKEADLISMGVPSNGEQRKERTAIKREQQAAKTEIESIFNACKKIISSYLRQD